jgi:tRNA-dihydrouridine synthase
MVRCDAEAEKLLLKGRKWERYYSGHEWQYLKTVRQSTGRLSLINNNDGLL